ncbi:PucR family transcriptional regulator [Tepidibacillus sp. LV47]|uniref:PucR family transcriptional regulator n=1 Tax=Tepidibacillus sp. LV47 TaxID=3398228 RepID=UPI003AAEEF10
MVEPSTTLFQEDFHSLQEFIDRLNEILRFPITLEDANHRLLAYSTHDIETDPARIATIVSRRVPDQVIRHLWEKGIIPTLLNSDEPLHIDKINEIGLGNRVAISIRNKQEVLGFIWVIEVERPLNQEELEILKEAAKAAKHLLIQHQLRRNKKKEDYQSFFLELLSGMVKSEQEIIKKFSQLKLTPPSLFTVLTLKLEKPTNPSIEKQISYMLKTSSRYPIVLKAILDQQLILLLSLAKHDEKYELDQYISQMIHEMKERFSMSTIFGGYGRIYDQFANIEKSYKEALTVLSLKERYKEEIKTVYGYQDLGIYQFFDILYEQRKKEGFLHPGLQKLRDYDQRYHHSLIETLEVYLDKDCNVNETAQILHIHVNTLTYRLRRITEIANINLKDPNQKISLYLDLKLEKMGK